jgi:GTP cyclohydrolase II
MDHNHQTDIQALTKTFLPTKWGDFYLVAYPNVEDEAQPHLALVHKDYDAHKPTYLRIHSECLTGDLFGSKRCDCGEQLDHALQLINQHRGILIYLRQEGRGIGLLNKLRAYNLQDQGLGTVEANIHLGFEPDERSFLDGVHIAIDLGVKEAVLITNNPEKVKSIQQSSIQLIERIPIIIPANAENKKYLSDKREKMGHIL